FGGDSPVGLEEAMDLVRDMSGYDDLERQFREAMRDLDVTRIDDDLAEQLLGPEARLMLGELRRMAQLLEEAGLIRRGARDMELTPKGIRRIGERALRTIFTELRKDR